MTIFYLDPENGNDAADGLTFANRWKTLTGGPTAARVAPGDEVRVMASRSPQSIGNGQWSDGSTFAAVPYRRVGLASPPFLVAEECDTGWVAANANVTVAHSNSSPSPRTGTNRLAVTFAAAFTTGKAAYKTLAGTTDFSAFQQLCFWICPTATTVTCNMQICLCSDTTGDVIVDTLAFDLGTTLTLTQWRSVLIDKGSALGASIQSIAIYVVADPSTSSRTICFDNIVACKGPDDPLCITNRSIIGKNTGGEPWWYPIWGLTGSDILIGSNYDTSLTEGSPQAARYIGVTENVTTYVINPTTGWVTADRTIAEGGHPAAPIKFTGGWNRTDMSTQVGDTWLTGYHWIGSVFTTSIMHVTMEKIGAVNYTATPFPLQHGWRIDTPGVLGCTGIVSNVDESNGRARKIEFVCKQVFGCREGVGETLSGGYRLKVDRIHGGGTVSTKFGLTIGEFCDGIDEIEIGVIEGCYQGGARVTCHGVSLVDTIIRYNSSNDINFENYAGAQLFLENVTHGWNGIPSQSGAGFMVRQSRIGGNPNLHKTNIPRAYFESQNTVTHSAGYAWKFGLDYWWNLTGAIDNYFDYAPARFELAKFAVEANKLVTVKCWLRRSDTAFALGLEFRNKALPGVTKTHSLMTAAANTWEEVTITCTPTEAGVLTVNAIGYGTGSVQKLGMTGYVDDLTITQAA